MEYYKHETAIVDDGVEIGEGTKIWAFSHIMKGAKVGKNCVIGEGVHIGDGVIIGDGCKIQNHSILYEGVTLEDGVFLGPNVITTNDIEPNIDTSDWRKRRFRETLFKKGSSVGANCTIICGNELGENCLVGAGSVVTRDVPKNTVVVGNPAEFMRKI